MKMKTLELGKTENKNMITKQYSMDTKLAGSIWKAIFALAVAALAFAGIQSSAETLTVEYTLEGIEGIRHELQVKKDVEELEFNERSITSLTLPEGFTRLRKFSINNASLTNLSLPNGLTNLRTLKIYDCGLSNLILPKGLVSLELLIVTVNSLTSLKLPEDFGKNTVSEGGNLPYPQLWIDKSIEQLSVHYKMKEFGIERYYPVVFEELVFPPAKDLIRNRTADSDGVFRIHSRPATIAGHKVGFDSDGYFQMELHGPLLLEVYGLEPTLTITRKADGVEVGWEAGTLQRSLLIDGPWKDVESGGTDRRLFLRPSHPYEFFRVKPAQ